MSYIITTTSMKTNTIFYQSEEIGACSEVQSATIYQSKGAALSQIECLKCLSNSDALAFKVQKLVSVRTWSQKGSKVIYKEGRRVIGFVYQTQNGACYAFGSPSQSSFLAFEVDSLETAKNRVETLAWK